MNLLEREPFKIAAIVLATIAYVAIHLIFHLEVGDALFVLAVFPVVLVAWFYGPLPGLLAGLLSYPFNLIIASRLKDTQFFSMTRDSVMGTLAIVALGTLVGWMREVIQGDKRLVSRLEKVQLELRQLAQIVESSNDAILSKDLNGVIQTWNEGARQMYGYSAQEMIGRSVDLLLPANRPDEVKNILKGIGRGERVDHFDTYRRVKDGRVIPVSLTISPIKDEQGEIIGASTIARDISERKNVERLRDEFVAIVTHDLKSPLIAVLGYSDVLLSGLAGPLPEKQRSFIATIKKEGLTLQEMIDSILDYTRAEFGKIQVAAEPFSLNDLVVETIAELKPLAEQKKIALSADLPAAALVVNADRGMITRVLANLLSNALKYTPEGGKVDISLARLGSQARFAVRDSGVGIPADKLDRVFDKFYMVETAGARKRQSLGLGLYIARSFIEAHHGAIKAESAGPGQGATFSFTIPCTVSA